MLGGGAPSNPSALPSKGRQATVSLLEPWGRLCTSTCVISFNPQSASKSRYTLAPLADAEIGWLSEVKQLAQGHWSGSADFKASVPVHASVIAQKQHLLLRETTAGSRRVFRGPLSSSRTACFIVPLSSCPLSVPFRHGCLLLQRIGQEPCSAQAGQQIAIPALPWGLQGEGRQSLLLWV